MPGTTDISNVNDGLIDRYLNHGLDDVERAAFELMLLEDAQLFARVQLLASLKNALVEEGAASGTFDVTSTTSW